LRKCDLRLIGVMQGLMATTNLLRLCTNDKIHFELRDSK